MSNPKSLAKHQVWLEKAMAPHSSTLAWKIPRMEEPFKAAVHRVTTSWTRVRDFTFTFHFHTLEKEMATHSSVLAWRIPGTGEPGGLPSLGSHRVGHDWSDLAAAAASLIAAVLWGFNLPDRISWLFGWQNCQNFLDFPLRTWHHHLNSKISPENVFMYQRTHFQHFWLKTLLASSRK